MIVPTVFPLGAKKLAAERAALLRELQSLTYPQRFSPGTVDTTQEKK
mgnify:CR=1 FL=1